MSQAFLSRGYGFVRKNKTCSHCKKQKGELQICRNKNIDDVIPDNEKITLIKIDAEGSEYPILRGTERIITNFKPKLAVAIYQSVEDMLFIPKYLKQLVPEYKLHVRHYSKGTAETVLYAYI